jgi:hypothetical protein
MCRREIEDVVVLDAVIGGTSGEDVPHCLKNRSRDEPGVSKAELRQTLKQDFVYSISGHFLDQIIHVHKAVPDLMIVFGPASRQQRRYVLLSLVEYDIVYNQLACLAAELGRIGLDAYLIWSKTFT